MTVPRTESFLNPHTQKPVANQLRIWTHEGVYFQSYNRLIVFVPYTFPMAKKQLDRFYWNYSITTARYRNIFLGESVNTTREKLASGEYELMNLNGEDA